MRTAFGDDRKWLCFLRLYSPKNTRLRFFLVLQGNSHVKFTYFGRGGHAF